MDKNNRQMYMIEIAEFLENKHNSTKVSFGTIRYLRMMKTKIAGYMYERCPVILAVLRKMKVDALLRRLLGVVEK